MVDGTNGFLFDYDNSNDLAATINKAYGLKEKDGNPHFQTRESRRKILNKFCHPIFRT